MIIIINLWIICFSSTFLSILRCQHKTVNSQINKKINSEKQTKKNNKQNNKSFLISPKDIGRKFHKNDTKMRIDWARGIGRGGGFHFCFFFVLFLLFLFFLFVCLFVCLFFLLFLFFLPFRVKSCLFILLQFWCQLPN